ncbi:MAG: hypothetical protein GC129_07270 [Proteobacteria bacterium]|nr:hypothetical protein [Pseudomonadota bacterium]
MLMFRRLVSWRLLGVLALVLAFAGVAGSGFADAAASTTPVDPYAFPYFGPDPTGKSLIAGSFIAQADLMGAFATKKDTASSPLKTMALFAALIGALFLVFRQSMWRLEVIAPWMIILVLLVFTPISSGLLMQPITMPKGVAMALTYGISGIANGNDSLHYAFAPQVAAVDVASRAQLIVSNMFRSTGWRDLIGYMLATQRLRSSPYLKSNPGWVHDLQNYQNDPKQGCGLNLKSMTDAVNNPPSDTPTGGASSAVNEQVYTVGDVWKTWRDFYKNGSFLSSAPPVAVLYSDNDLPASFDKGVYARGIQALYDNFVGGPQKIVQVGGGGNTINVETALNALAGVNFFKPVLKERTANSVIEPGFFFVRSSEAISKVDKVTKAVPASFTDKTTAFEMRMCGQDSLATTRSPICYTRGNPLNPSVQAATFVAFDKSLGAVGDLDAMDYTGSRVEQGPTYNALNGPLWLNLKNAISTGNLLSMPVKPLGIQGVGGTSVSVSGDTSCAGRGLTLVKNGLQTFANQFNKEVGTPQPLVDMLCGTDGAMCKVGGNNAAIQDQLELKDIFTNPDKLPSDVKSIADILKDYLNGKLRDFAYMHANDTDAGAVKLDDKRLFLLASMIDLIGVSSNQALTKTEREALANSGTVNVAGSAGLTSIGGGLAFFLGQVLLEIGAFFSGPVAQAFVAFITLLVQLSLLALIVLTPFLLLGGLLMPGAALGVLTTSILAAFVLQFVPVTLIMLNYLGGFVYDMVGAVAGPSADTMQNTIVMGMSGLYTAVVGLTFFLMFKLGDPAAIMGRLASLDSTAKEMSERGIDYVKAGALVAASVATGGVTGMLRANKGYNDVSDAQAEALNPGGEKGAPEELIKPGENGPDGGGGIGGLGGAAVDVLAEASAQAEGMVGAEGWAQVEDDELAGADRHDIVDQLRQNPNNPTVARGNFEYQETPQGLERRPIMAATDAMKEGEAEMAAGASGASPAAGGGTEADIHTQIEAAGGLDVGEKARLDDGRWVVRNKNVGGKPSYTTVAGPSGGAAANEAPNGGVAPQGQGPSGGNVPPAVGPSGPVSAALQPGGGPAAVTGGDGGALDRLSAALRENTAALNHRDQVAAHQGAEALGLRAQDQRDNISEMGKNFGANARPSRAQTLLSGFYGGVMANFQGASSIPFVGKAIAEAWNENVEAEMRARTWNGSGGYKKWRRAKDDNDRAAAWNKFSGEVSGAESYRESFKTGAFQAKLDSDRQAMREATHKLRSSYEAMATQAKDKGRASHDVVMRTEELRGLGLEAAYGRLNNLKAENMVLNNPVLKIKVAEFDANGKLTGKMIEKETNISHRIFDKWTNNAAAKSANKFMDEAGKVDMGIVEKRFMRGGAWDEARNMRKSSKAMAAFVREDVDTDYITAGYHKIVGGKNQWMKIMQESDEFNKRMTTERKNIESYAGLQVNKDRLEREASRKVAEMRAENKIPPEVFADAALERRYTRSVVEKLAKKEMEKHSYDELPATALFDQTRARATQTIVRNTRIGTLGKVVNNITGEVTRNAKTAYAEMLKARDKGREVAEELRELLSE